MNKITKMQKVKTSLLKRKLPSEYFVSRRQEYNIKRAWKEYREGKGVVFNTPQEVKEWLQSLREYAKGA
jgi:hypothetical protein